MPQKNNHTGNKKSPLRNIPQSDSNRKPKFTLSYIYLLVALALIVYWMFSSPSGTMEIDNSRFNHGYS